MLTQLPDTMRGKRILSAGESFRFACHPGVACFNRCCADVNILLGPTDVLRLSRRVEMTTTEFLAVHTLIPITKDLHLPVPLLRMRDEPQKRCPFLTEAGCGVYQDRPWACRMYPLGMGLPPARAGEEPAPVYFLFEDDFCLGREAAASGAGEPAPPGVWTIEGWMADQEVVERDALDAGFRSIVSHPWFIGGRTLDPRRVELFHMAFYDLDRFRMFVFESSFLDRFELEAELIERLRADDEALLDFASRWLRFALFGEPTLPLRAQTPKTPNP